MVTRELLLQQAENERNPSILDLWRDELRHELRKELDQHFFTGTDQYENILHRAMIHIEQYGCSVQKAVDRIMNPDNYIGMKEHA